MDLNVIGFTGYDFALLVACTIGGFFGSLAQAIVATINPNGPPRQEGITYFASEELRRARGAWLTMRFLLGAILGFVFGLYFVGTLHETAATFAKVWALSFVVGYAAPKIWTAKSDALLRSMQTGTEGLKDS
ncbi:hypothetical protein [Pseudomonas nitroreducens]|uniref:hypothetical protein n=1 Tax=Pseudomonas nitroreducens TaxID=46680 RepID=UPI0018741B76|nr:hypothetical protein [Pseudomonas nitritireducens]